MGRNFLSVLLFVVLSGSGAAAAADLLSSTFPIYLISKNIIAGSSFYEPELMVDSLRGCPHDYAPTAADLERLSQARVLIINGLGLDAFLNRAFGVARSDLRIIDASGGAEAASGQAAAIVRRPEDLAAESQAHDHDHEHSGPNPHLFASPSTTARLALNIAQGLAETDPDNAALYLANGERYAERLGRLARVMAQTGASFGRPKVIVSHGIFEYLAQDLGLDILGYLEPADGAEPSAAHLSHLSSLAREKGARAILVDPEANLDLARTLGAETGLPVAIIDLAASGPMDAPQDYFEQVMLQDLAVLQQLFSQPEAETAPPQ